MKNQLKPKFSTRYFIEDNNGASLGLNGQFRYEVKEIRHGKAKPISITEPISFRNDGKSFTTSNRGKAHKEIGRICQLDPHLSPKWFKVSSAQVLSAKTKTVPFMPCPSRNESKWNGQHITNEDRMNQKVWKVIKRKRHAMNYGQNIFNKPFTTTA